MKIISLWNENIAITKSRKMKHHLEPTQRRKKKWSETEYINRIKHIDFMGS